MGLKVTKTIFGCCWWSLALFTFVQSIPISSNPDSNDFQYLNKTKFSISSVCIYNNMVYASGENFTTNDPCEVCTCHPPKHTCMIRTCALNPGCKAVQKTQACCPEYVCECESNGKRFGNGEKVEEPNPCKVCYCSGGQIKCSLITCYFRDDCKPIYVEGRCCPKYDNCPPLEMSKNITRIPPSSEVTESTQELLLSESPNANGSTSSASDFRPELYSSEEIKDQTVATLEIIEIHPTGASAPEDRFPFQTGSEETGNESYVDVGAENVFFSEENAFEEEFGGSKESTGHRRGPEGSDRVTSYGTG